MKQSLRRKFKNVKITTIGKKDYIYLVQQLESYGFKNYQDFLNSALWKEFRKYIPKKTAKCNICNTNLATIAHHFSYRNLLNINGIRWVCKECHEEIHTKIKTLKGHTPVKIVTFKLKRKKSPKIHKPKPLLKFVRDIHVEWSIIGYNGAGGKNFTKFEDFKEAWLKRTRQEYLDIYWTKPDFFDEIMQRIIKKKEVFKIDKNNTLIYNT